MPLSDLIQHGREQSPPRIIIYGPEKIGKCLGKGTPVLMFDGTIKAVEDVRVGDKLIGPDSYPRVVLNLSNGVAPLYRVTQKRNSYVVTGNHVLSLRLSRTVKECVRRRAKPLHQHVLISVEDYLCKSPTFRKEAMGWMSGVEWDESFHEYLPIPAYFLGAWLGDGHSSNTCITTMDNEIHEAMTQYASMHGIGLSVKRGSTRGKAATWRISGSSHNPNSNQMLNDLRDLDLIDNKHIPHIYKTASRENRLELLAGLIDTDGNIGGKKIHYEIIQKNEQLARDIDFLARSLGFSTHLRAIEKTCTNSKTKAIGVYWANVIGGNVSEIPVRIKRKEASTKKKRRNTAISSIKVEPIGDGEYFGFEVDGDHLFLLGDFTVTHNSTFASCAPDTVFIRTEDGLDQIDCAKLPLCKSYGQFIEQIGMLAQEDHQFKTLAIDSIDWLQKLIFSDVCLEGKKETISDFGYRIAYNKANLKWKEVLDGLDYLRDEKGMQHILIAHSKVEKFNDPDGSQYDRYSLALDKDATAILCEWSDAILFANQKKRIEKEDVGFNKVRAIGKPIGADGGDRILRCIGSPACVAGNRYDMPAELPLVWDEAAKFFY